MSAHGNGQSESEDRERLQGSAMRIRLLIAVLLLFATGGCGGGSSCPVELVHRHVFNYEGIPVACCGASEYRDVQIVNEDAEVDIAFTSQEVPPLAHAWLTTTTCQQLFDGDYPPAVGSPSPRCTVYLGPVSPRQVSSRRSVPPGMYRLWVQAFSSSPQPQRIFADVGVWAPQCGSTKVIAGQ